MFPIRVVVSLRLGPEVNSSRPRLRQSQRNARRVPICSYSREGGEGRARAAPSVGEVREVGDAADVWADAAVGAEAVGVRRRKRTRSTVEGARMDSSTCVSNSSFSTESELPTLALS